MIDNIDKLRCIEREITERAERWRRTKAKRIAEGKCWQCVLPIEQCRCPNIRRGVGSKP